MARAFHKRDKKVQKMSRDGLVERNLSTGEETRASRRGQDFDLRHREGPTDGASFRDTLSGEPGRFHSGHTHRIQPQNAQADPVPPAEAWADGNQEIPPGSSSAEAPLPGAAPDGPSQSAQSPNQRFSSEAPAPGASGASFISHDRHARDDDSRASPTSASSRSKPNSAPAASDPSRAAPTGRSSRLAFAKDEQPPGTAPTRPPGAKPVKGPAPPGSQPNARKQPQGGAQGKKTRRRLRFEGDGKPSIPNPAGIGADQTVRLVHAKVREAEEENVGVEAAHRTELVIEGALRKGYRMHKDLRHRHTAKLREKAAKETYRQTLRDPSNRRSHVLSRAAQRRRIKKRYARAVREAGRKARSAAKAAGKTVSASGKAIGFVVRHPIVSLVLVLILLLIMLLISALSSCSGVTVGGLSSVVASSYLANDADIDAAELAYTEWEADLLLEIAGAEATHGGYDEYRYSVDDVGHNPHELMAFLTSVYQDFTADEARAVLREVFEEQYTLAFTPETETRYRDPDDTNEDGDTEPYDWRVMNVTLTARSFTDVIAPRMDASQREIADLLMATYGNRQYLVNPFDFNWLPNVTVPYGWRVDPDTGAKDFHTGVDIAVAAGTPILAGHDGVVASAGSEGASGLTVVLVGEEDLVSRYAQCAELFVSAGQKVGKGELIAKAGSSGGAASPRLHFEVMKGGTYLNPLFFAQTGDDGTGRIPPGTPGGPAIPENPGTPMDDGRYAALIEEAEKHLGKPYVFGASGPDRFDCSGFICYVLEQSGVADVGRTTAQGLFNLSTPVSAEDARPGDLIFFQGTYSTSNTVTHVGIVTGDGQMLHCGKPVQYASFGTNYWKEHFYAFARP